MVVYVKTCSICNQEVRDKLDSMGIPYTTSGNQVTVNITSPTTWSETSLAAMCWRQLRFSYHEAVRRGNTIKCSRAR